MEKKKKKRLIIIAVILAGVILAALIVYFVINLVFSIFGNSFYETVIPADPVQTVAEPTTEPPVETEEQEAQTPQKVPPKAEKADDDALFESLSVSKLNLTSAEFKAIQKKILFADKVAVLNILSTGLSAAEYKELIGMLSGGITSSEVKRAYQILSQSLSSENKEKNPGILQ